MPNAPQRQESIVVWTQFQEKKGEASALQGGENRTAKTKEAEN